MCLGAVVFLKVYCLFRLHRSVYGHSDADSGHPVHWAHLSARQPAPQPHRLVKNLFCILLERITVSLQEDKNWKK